MDMSMPPLQIEILLESNPPKSRIVVRGLAVSQLAGVAGAAVQVRLADEDPTLRAARARGAEMTSRVQQRSIASTLEHCV